LGFVPGGALAAIDESGSAGRVFLHYPGVLIALSATKPFPWDRQAAIRYASGTPRPGDSEFRVPGPTFAAAIETATAEEFPGATPMQRLRAFRDAIVAKTHLQLIQVPGTGAFSGSYTDLEGNMIRRVFGGDAEVNGKKVDFAHWPWAESPWVDQPSRNSPLTVTDGKRVRTYDFTNWTITER
jgi:hypothetical protein